MGLDWVLLESVLRFFAIQSAVDKRSRYNADWLFVSFCAKKKESDT
jgi:hypothetical protein